MFFFFPRYKIHIIISSRYMALQCFSQNIYSMYSIAICTFVEGTGDHGLVVAASSLLTASQPDSLTSSVQG